MKTPNGAQLCQLGFSYHEFGSLRKNGQKIANYFKGDKLTEQTRAAILAAYPHAYFLSSSPQYAPEMVRSLVCFPIRRRTA